MQKDNFYSKIIPPNDHEHRNGFDNKPLIDSLNIYEKSSIEDLLIDNLSIYQEDMLIIETLGYLKSEKALPKLYRMLDLFCNSINKIIIASAIYEICQDENLSQIVIREFTKVQNGDDPYKVYSLIAIFYYMAKFKDPVLYDLIAKYRFSQDPLLAHNSNEALKTM